VLKNLSRSFPEKSEDELNRIADKFYKNFSDVTLEVLKSISLNKKSLGNRVHFKNPEITFELKEKNQPLLFYASHQCNWEWMAQASGLKLSVPGDVIYKPLEKFL
jgi:KDO2-lipid IV(A) lauroyltransferase